ncbi:hypothetical protein LCGC14_2144430 [marine sediment metagenome]|uniref:Uncharacterized protein n=1 Tax=marine sediment metagenome TaxID=412755 RepID=A0A0F9DXE8_9ZZZZ
MKVKPKQEHKLIPEWNGNHDLDEKDQMVVYYKRIKNQGAIKYSQIPGSGKKKQRETQRRIFIDHVLRIVKFWIGDDEIKTGQELYDHPDTEFKLVHEIIRAIEGKTDEDEDLAGN